jgi:hypothetical protein
MEAGPEQQQVIEKCDDCDWNPISYLHSVDKIKPILGEVTRIT